MTCDSVGFPGGSQAEFFADVVVEGGAQLIGSASFHGSLVLGAEGQAPVFWEPYGEAEQNWAYFYGSQFTSHGLRISGINLVVSGGESSLAESRFTLARIQISNYAQNSVAIAGNDFESSKLKTGCDNQVEPIPSPEPDRPWISLVQGFKLWAIP